VKQPVTLTPYNHVPTVGVITHPEQEAGNVYLGGLQTSEGPQSAVGRHAIVMLTRNQAEALLYDLARRLGMTVS
jgi:hypothetical protein